MPWKQSGFHRLVHSFISCRETSAHPFAAIPEKSVNNPYDRRAHFNSLLDLLNWREGVKPLCRSTAFGEDEDGRCPSRSKTVRLNLVMAFLVGRGFRHSTAL